MKNENNKNKKIHKLLSIFLLLFSCIIFASIFQFNKLSITPINNKTTHPVQKIHAEENTDSIPQKKIKANEKHLLDQWNLNLMNVGEAWADGYNGEGIKIAVLDTGFYHKHPDSKIAGGNSVFSDEPWSVDHSGHGTHIAGIISAESGTKYQGIAPGAEVYGIKIYHSKDTNKSGDVSTDVNSVIKGIKLAIKMETDIIVISSGLNYHDEDLYKQINEAHEKNIMIIAASGNNNLSVNYPASYDEVIAVTAVDKDLNPALDIIYGHENEFTAPGVNIGGLSIPDSNYSYPYIYMSGSSQATPHVASLAAIFMQKYDVRGEEARKIMQENAIDIGDPGLFGFGLLYYEPADNLNNEEKNESNNGKNKKNKENKENDEKKNDEARKPSSSREEEKNEKELDENLLAHKEIKVTINQENKAVIDKDIFPTLKIGGTLDIFMKDASTLKLTEDQVADVREKNISLILSKEGVSWEIPPVNFRPGQANLRFYKGYPLGTKEKPNDFSNVYTISIFQAETREGVYPGQMKINFDLNRQKMPTPSKLDAAYYDKTEKEWLALEKKISENSITLETKLTGAIGFFEVNEEEIITEEKKNEENLSNLFILTLIVTTLIIIYSIYIFFTKKHR